MYGCWWLLGWMIGDSAIGCPLEGGVWVCKKESRLYVAEMVFGGLLDH